MPGVIEHDQSAIDNRPPNVAAQFLDRVKMSPQPADIADLEPEMNCSETRSWSSPEGW